MFISIVVQVRIDAESIEWFAGDPMIMGRSLLHTPAQARPFRVFASLLILTQPLISICFYTWNLLVGVYPSDADAIMIPIAGDFVAWLVWMPILLFLLQKTVFKGYPGAISFGVWNKDKPFWSLLWTVFFIALLIIPYTNIAYDVICRNPFEFLDTVLWPIFYAQLRAIIVTKPEVILGHLPWSHRRESATFS